jgi:hypothetical protein
VYSGALRYATITRCDQTWSAPICTRTDGKRACDLGRALNTRKSNNVPSILVDLFVGRFDQLMVSVATESTIGNSVGQALLEQDDAELQRDRSAAGIEVALGVAERF